MAIDYKGIAEALHPVMVKMIDKQTLDLREQVKFQDQLLRDQDKTIAELRGKLDGHIASGGNHAADVE